MMPNDGRLRPRAAGFGDRRPIDTAPEALARNRRIEFKLTDG